jgi:hypothetical protein
MQFITETTHTRHSSIDFTKNIGAIVTGKDHRIVAHISDPLRQGRCSGWIHIAMQIAEMQQGKAIEGWW